MTKKTKLINFDAAKLRSMQPFWVAMGITFGTLVPILITLESVQAPLSDNLPRVGVSPYGYTISQVLFIIPVLLIVAWLHFKDNVSLQRKAFYASCAFIFVFGCFLDFIFGYSFFHFPDPAATLQIRLPSYSFYEWRWIMDYLPLEEFFFYIFGAFFMVALYVFGDEYWFAAYNRLDYRLHARQLKRFVGFHVKSIYLALGLLAIGWLYKKFGAHPYNEGIPGYFTFEILLAIIPTILLFEVVGPAINYRAFSFMLVSLLLISVIWEATLGVPYGWWGYKFDQMLGIELMAWADLPIEAVILWFTAGWASVMIYEFFKIVMFHRSNLKQS